MQAVKPSALRALHAVLLQHLRVPVAAPLSRWGDIRTMSDGAHAQGTYLNRSDVVDRVLSIVKTNQKVDPAKVPSLSRVSCIWCCLALRDLCYGVHKAKWQENLLSGVYAPVFEATMLFSTMILRTGLKGFVLVLWPFEFGIR